MNNMSNKPRSSKKGLFIEALESVVFGLPKRSQEIVWSRFGIGGAKVATLEEIGKKFGITRERVRQVIREVCRKVKNKKESVDFSEVRKKISFTLDSNSGIMKQESLLNTLGGEDKGEKGAARFFLECLDDIKSFEIKGVSEKAYILAEFSENLWKRVNEGIVGILEKKNSPENDAELFEDFSKIEISKGFDKKKLFDFLAVSLSAKKNTFGKWGLSQWKEIRPKGTRDKAYLVLKEKGEPMHFKEIAESIDKSGLNKKKTHPQTVHNELIKDSKFVLVGRGIYALAEWGYEKGTVKDVILDVLKGNSRGLNKEEVIAEVLKVRKVKKSTVVINLNNHFSKNKEGVYTIRK